MILQAVITACQYTLGIVMYLYIMYWFMLGCGMFLDWIIETTRTKRIIAGVVFLFLIIFAVTIMDIYAHPERYPSLVNKAEKE